MKANKNLQRESLNEVSVMDVTTTKSAKKGGSKVDANIMDKTRTKTDIFADLRRLFDFDIIGFDKGLRVIAESYVNGKMDIASFEEKRAELRKSCAVVDCETFEDFASRYGVANLLNEISNLYGYSLDDIKRVFLVDGKIKVYSRDNNEDGTLNATENGLYFRYETISASSIIRGLAGAGTFFDRVRIEANNKKRAENKANKAVQTLKELGLNADTLRALLAQLS